MADGQPYEMTNDSENFLRYSGRNLQKGLSLLCGENVQKRAFTIMRRKTNCCL